MLNHSHEVCQYGIPVLALVVPGAVFWPYFAGTAVVGLGLAAGDRFNQARSFERVLAFGPLFFAIAMGVFGADHLTAAKFVAMAVPPWMPGRLFWAYFVGVALIAAALSLATKRYWHLASASLGVMIFLFVLMIHVPNWLKAPYNSVRLTILLRDLALSAGALAFATSWRELEVTKGTHLGRLRAIAPRLLTCTRFLVSIPITIFGIDHFLNPAFAPGIPQENQAVFVTMPAWIPVHTLWAYATGVIFVACGLAMMSRRHARMAAGILGVTVLALIVLVYIPLTVSKASDIANGLNYLAIHFALAGAAFLLAVALPAWPAEESSQIAEDQQPILNRAG